MRRILIAGVLLAAACAKKDRTDASGQGTGTARAVLATPDAASAVADAEPPPPPRAPPPPVTLPGGKPLALADCAKVTDDFKREACELLFEDVVLCHERGGESAECIAGAIEDYMDAISDEGGAGRDETEAEH